MVVVRNVSKSAGLGQFGLGAGAGAGAKGGLSQCCSTCPCHTWSGTGSGSILKTVEIEALRSLQLIP